VVPVLDRGHGMGCGELACFSETTLGGKNGINGIYWRVECRMGELLADMDKHKGGRPSGNRFHDGTSLSRSLNI